jgi:hypothetical protein
VLTQEGGKLSALFTSKTVFYNQDLAAYYGLSAGSSFESTTFDHDRAFGMLTLPAVLSLLAKPAESSPIYRGKFVREALLCQLLPAPPPNIPKPPDVEPGVSTRERLSQHEQDEACSSCHSLIDQIGFGFEHYDTLGRYRSEDGGKPVDASGEVFDTDDLDGKFVGVGELARRLASSTQVQECVTRQWFRFALSRFERDVDNCNLKRILDRLRASEVSLNVLPRALIESDAFMYRRPLDAKGSP